MSVGAHTHPPSHSDRPRFESESGSLRASILLPVARVYRAVTTTTATMSDDESGGSEPPYTTDELTERELTMLDIEDQIRYAIYNGHYRIGAIVEQTAFGKEWTLDIVEDMVEYGDLLKSADDTGPFYVLPDDAPRHQTLTEAEIAELHVEARLDREETKMVGDPDDIKAARRDRTTETETTDSDDAYAHTDASDMSETSDDTVSADETETPTPAEVKEAKAAHGGMLPVDREYDWAEYRLEGDRSDYIESDGEYTDIKLEIEDRRDTGKLPHFNISGPTGCGKTTLAETFAHDMDAVVFEIHCHEGLRPSNLLGMPTYVGDETWWVDGPVPKALLASQERPTVVILDEVNRTSARVLGVLMSMLDHRARCTLDARGGETVEGNPMNLIVFSTMNEGEGYVVNSVDTAQKRRLGNKYYVDYIGMNDSRAEADLIADRTPVSRTVAMSLVKCANDIRDKATSDSAVSIGVPTDTMLDWASTAWSYRDQTTPKGPLVKAGERAVLNKFYRGDSTEEDTVRTIIESHLEGMGLDGDTDESEATTMDEEVGSASGGTIDISEETYLMCESCGWYSKAEEADDEVATTMTCPDCESPVIPKESA